MHVSTPRSTDLAQTDEVGSPGQNRAAATSDRRLDDLSQMIRAYHEVTEKLQISHESLEAQVKSLQRQLVSTNAKLQRSKRLAALGEMAAGIAHEIRNPLGAIQLYAGMLVEDLSAGLTSSQNQAEMLQTAQKIAVAVRGLDAVVHDVLSFSRELEPQLRLIRVRDLFDRVIEICQPMIEAAHIVVRRLDHRSSLQVRVDSDLVHQALLNLVRNAVEAISGSKQPVRDDRSQGVLTLDAHEGDHQLTLVVRDTGPGIEASEIDRIFNPFFTTRNTGTGLGLAIVHRIMDAHSGTIGVHNDGGAVFELSLPRWSTTPVNVESEGQADRLCQPLVP